MKKYLLGLSLLAVYCYVNLPKASGTYTILRDAGNLTRGILPNPRIDCSSITCLGTNVGVSINDSTSALRTQISTTAALAYGLSLSSDTLRLAITTTAAQAYNAVIALSSANIFANQIGDSTGTLRTAITTGAAKVEDYQAFRSSGDTQSQVFTAHMASVTARFGSVSSSTDTLRTLISSHSLIVSNTNYLEVSITSQTKLGGLGIIGSFGVGIATPSRKLEVLHGSILVRGNNAGIFLQNGNVGIGTLVPNVMGQTDPNASYIGFISSIPTNDGTELPVSIELAGRTEFEGTKVGTLLYGNRFSGSYSRLEGFAHGASLDSIGFKFYTANAGNVSNSAMKISGNGNVLIGTETTAGMTTPGFASSMLHISGGSITITGASSGISLSSVNMTVGGRIVFPNASIQDIAAAPPLSLYDEGASQGNGNLTTIDCVGANIACTQSGATATVTITGGGAVTNSTLSFTLKAGGDVFLATNSFIPVQGASRMVSVATETTVSMQAFTLYPSTVGSTFFKIAKATATGAGIPTAWTYISPHMEVSTQSVYGSIFSTAVTFNANESYALHVTSYPVAGRAPSEYGVKIRYWFNPYP